METIGLAVSALGSAISACAAAWASVYIVGIVAKTFLIYTEKATVEEAKDWFNFLKKNNTL